MSSPSFSVNVRVSTHLNQTTEGHMQHVLLACNTVLVFPWLATRSFIHRSFAVAPGVFMWPILTGLFPRMSDLMFVVYLECCFCSYLLLKLKYVPVIQNTMCMRDISPRNRSMLELYTRTNLIMDYLNIDCFIHSCLKTQYLDYLYFRQYPTSWA